MVYQKKYISFLLLAGFVFPQAANGLHYFLLPHPDYNKTSNAHSIKNLDVYEYHYCDYHLTGTDFAFIKEDDREAKKEPVPFMKEIDRYSPIPMLRVCYSYLLRGPPLSIYIQGNYMN